MTTLMEASWCYEGGILYSLPEAADRLRDVLISPQASNDDIREIIIRDPGLAFRILRLANATPPGGGIDTVSGALARLNRHRLSAALGAIPQRRDFPGLSTRLIDMDRFWLNSIACSHIAHSLALHGQVAPAESLRVAGLLHKLGRLALYTGRADLYRRILSHCGATEDALNHEEFRVFGLNHAQVGGALLRAAGLPDRCHSAVSHYLAPARAGRHRRWAAIIHVASAMACDIEPSVNLDTSRYFPALNIEQGAMDLLNLPGERLRLIGREAWAETIASFDLARSRYQRLADGTDGIPTV